MKKRYSEEKIIRAIKEHESGVKVDGISRKLQHIQWHALQLA